MNAFNGKCHFQGFPALEPLNRFSKKFAQLITSVTPPTSKNLDQSALCPKGACLRMREIVIVRRLFFRFFFSFMLIATGPPVGPIIAVNGLNDAVWWHAHSLYGLVNENWNLPPLAPQIWKFALRPMATSKTRAPLKIRARCLHQTGGFRGRAIKWYYSNFR